MTTTAEPDEDQQLSIGEAARRLRISVETLRRWEASGKVSAVRTPGGQRRFPSSQIDALLRR